MKKIALITLSSLVLTVMGSCCCQDQDAPPLRKMPRFNDISQPGEVIMPYKGKK